MLSILFYLVFPSNDPWEIWKPIEELQKMWEILKLWYVWLFLETLIGFKRSGERIIALGP